MSSDQKRSKFATNQKSRGAFSPLGLPFYRNVWLGSIVANMGLLIQGVGSAWIMTEMSGPTMVALVQSATFLPILLLAIPAGAAADIYDRRNVLILAISMAFIAAASMTIVVFLGLITPWLLLLFCFSIGVGVALFGPALQASIREQVPQEYLSNAIALNSASYNLGRSIGPAIGGVLVSTFGAVVVFGINALCYLPMLIVLLFWKYKPDLPESSSDSLLGTIGAGIRHVYRTEILRTPLIRTFIFGLIGSSVIALMPVFVRSELSGSAGDYGMLLSAFGVGAILGVLSLARLSRFTRERMVSGITIVMAGAMIALSFSNSVFLSLPAVFLIGASWTMIATTLTTILQTTSPSWLTGRVVSLFQATFSGGVVLGSVIWGVIAQHLNSGNAVMLSAVCMFLSILLHYFIPLTNGRAYN